MSFLACPQTLTESVALTLEQMPVMDGVTAVTHIRRMEDEGVVSWMPVVFPTRNKYTNSLSYIRFPDEHLYLRLLETHGKNKSLR